MGIWWQRAEFLWWLRDREAWFDPTRFDGYERSEDGIGCPRCHTYYMKCKVCDRGS